MIILAQVQAFLDQVNIMRDHLNAIGNKMSQTNLREMFANMVRLYVTDYDRTMQTFDATAQNGDYLVPIRVYLPKGHLEQNLQVAVYLHGGGHVVGGIKEYDGALRILTTHINHIVIAVDYRLSPEFAYPIALTDAKSVIKNVFSLLDNLNIGYLNQNLTIIGDSAGGALSASIVMDQEFVQLHNIKTQVLIYPSLDYTCSFPSHNIFRQNYLLEKVRVDWYFQQYFQHNEDRKSVSPLYGDFYPQMPKTLVITASHDMLHDEGVAYYNKLCASNVNAELFEVKGVVHPFLLLENLNKKECISTYNKINEFLG